MEVYANARLKVDVDPIQMLEALIENEIHRNYVFEENGKYYLGWEESRGAHSSDEQSEIPKERYDYVRSLQSALKYLKQRKMDRGLPK